MASTRISDIKGPKGEDGADSTIPGPRGLPGVNAVPADAAVAAYIGDLESQTGAAVSDKIAIFEPEMFGDCPGDGTDISAPLLAAVAAAQGAAGQVRLRPGKYYRAYAPLAPAHTGGASTTQRPVRITTPGASTANGRWLSNPLNGGATLDLRYDGTDGLHPAKIDTRGAGRIEIDHVNLISGGTDDFPIFQTTNTTPHIHHCFVQGNVAKSGTTCKQDAFLLGGTTQTLGDGADAPFQGYGGSIHDNFFDHIRRGVVGRRYCNSIPVENNTFSLTCGNDGTGTENVGAAIEFHGSSTGETATGNSTRGNTIEVNYYKYGVGGTYMGDCSFGPDGVWDAATVYEAAYYMGAGADFNSVTSGVHDTTFPLVAGPGAITTTIRTGSQSRGSFYPQPSHHRGVLAVQNTSGLGLAMFATSGDQGTIEVGAGAPGYPIINLSTVDGVVISDLSTTSGSAIVTSATAAWTREDQYMPIKAAGIPAGSIIMRRINATTVELSAPATATATGVAATFGRLGLTPTAEVGFWRRHLMSKGQVGSATRLGAAGSTGSPAAPTAVGTDMAFTLTLPTGGDPGVGDLVVIGAGINWVLPPKYSLTARNAAAAAAMGSVYLPTKNAGTNTWLTTAVALAPSTTYIWDFHGFA